VLAYRQTLAAHKLGGGCRRAPGMYFPKEISATECIATVDVIYPSSHFHAGCSVRGVTEGATDPCTGICQYGALALAVPPPHDLGQYPHANGQVYGGGERTEDNQMPLCGRKRQHADHARGPGAHGGQTRPMRAKLIGRNS